MGGILKGSIAGIQSFYDDPKYLAQEKEQIQLGEAQKKLFDFASAQERERGQQQAAKAFIQGGQVVGQERAALGASGVDANSGSAARAQAATRMFSAMDASRTQYDAAASAWNYEMKGQEARTHALEVAMKLQKMRQDSKTGATADVTAGELDAASFGLGKL